VSVFSISRYHKFSSIFSVVHVSWPPRELDQKTVESNTRHVVEQGSMSFPVYIDTLLGWGPWGNILSVKSNFVIFFAIECKVFVKCGS